MWILPRVITPDARNEAASTIERAALAIAGSPIPPRSLLARWVHNLRAGRTLTPSRGDEWRLAAAYSDLVLAIRLANALARIEPEVAQGRCIVDPTIFTNQMYRVQDDADMPKGHAELHVAGELLRASPENAVNVLGVKGEGRDVLVTSPSGQLDVEVRCRQFLRGWMTDGQGLGTWIRSKALHKARGFPSSTAGSRVIWLDVTCHTKTAEAALAEAGPQLARFLGPLNYHRVGGVLVSTVQLDIHADQCGYALVPRFFAVDETEPNDPKWCGLGRLCIG